MLDKTMPAAVMAREGVKSATASRTRQMRRFSFWMASPAFMVLALLALPPTFGALWLAFQNRSLERAHSHWVGFANFHRLWRDYRFWNALEITGIWEVITVLGAMVVALILGILLFEKVRGRTLNFVCLGLLLPILLPRIAAGLIWRFMLSPLMGIINYPFHLLGLQPIAFLDSPATALYAVAMVDVWQWGLFFAVILVKAMQTLPKSPMEAAHLDGARVWQLHLFVNLPALRGTLITMVFVKAVESLRSFDLIYTMTTGGPGVATETLDLYAYQAGIGISGRISYAAAMSVLLMLTTTIIFSLTWKKTRKWR